MYLCAVNRDEVLRVLKACPGTVGTSSYSLLRDPISWSGGSIKDGRILGHREAVSRCVTLNGVGHPEDPPGRKRRIHYHITRSSSAKRKYNSNEDPLLRDMITLANAFSMPMHKFTHKGCTLLYGCLNAREHAYIAWVFVFTFPLFVIAIGGVSVARSKRRDAKRFTGDLLEGVVTTTPGRVNDESRQLTEVMQRRNEPNVYSAVEPHARNVKAVLQMMIGIIAICVVGWHFLDARTYGTHQATSLLIDGIGVGLAAAAVLELAYTLFTSGPDEALDPLMLALAAALLIQLANLQGTPSPAQAIALLLQGALLAVLFATRLMLAERNEDDDRPNIWWIPKRRQ